MLKRFLYFLWLFRTIISLEECVESVERFCFVLKLPRIVCYKYSDCEGFICKYFYLIFFGCNKKSDGSYNHKITFKLEGISRSVWSNSHLEPGPFKFDYSQRWRTHNLSRQPALVFDGPRVKTFLLIPDGNFSRPSVCLLPPVLSQLAELIPESPCPSCTGEPQTTHQMWCQKQHGKARGDLIHAGYGLLLSCPLLQGCFAHSRSVCSSGSSGVCCFLSLAPYYTGV